MTTENTNTTETRRLNKVEKRQAHSAAPHMTRAAFVRAYGESALGIWYHMNKNMDPREVDPWRWPDYSIRLGLN